MAGGKKQGPQQDFAELTKERERNRQRNQQVLKKREKQLAKKDQVKEKMKQKAFKAAKKNSKKSFWKEYSEDILFGIFIAFLIGLIVYSKYFGKGSNIGNLQVFDNEYLAQINEGSNKYVVGENEYFRGMTINQARKLMSNGISRTQGIAKCKDLGSDMEIQEEYNFVTEHPECFRGIFDQGKCSSSFATTVASVFSDRTCLANAEDKFVAGSHYPLSCESRRVNGKLF